MPDATRPELLMPVSDDKAAKLIEIEALRQIADNLKRLNDRSDEHIKLLHGMDARLIRIESNRVDSRVEELEKKVDDLQSERDMRRGAMGLAQWLKDFGPWLLAVLLGILALVGWEHKG